MSELLKFVCTDCIQQEFDIDHQWYAIYAAFFHLSRGEYKLMEIVNMDTPLEVAKFGGSNIMTHHNGVRLVERSMGHSFFDIHRVGEKDKIGFLRVATKIQRVSIE